MLHRQDHVRDPIQYGSGGISSCQSGHPVDRQRLRGVQHANHDQDGPEGAGLLGDYSRGKGRK